MPKPLKDGHPGGPTHESSGTRDIGSTDTRIVYWTVLKRHLAAAAGCAQDKVGDVQYSEFLRIPQVDRVVD